MGGSCQSTLGQSKAFFITKARRSLLHLCPFCPFLPFPRVSYLGRCPSCFDFRFLIFDVIR